MSLVLIDRLVNWDGAFAWSQERGGHGLTICHFRLTFKVDAVPSQLLAHVTADSRYRLLLNGQALGRGPLKGTLEHYHVETYDLAPHLRPGRNVLAAEVRWFGINAPTSEVHSPLPGFLVKAPAFPSLNTPGDWRTRLDRSVSPDTTAYYENAQLFLNHTERVDLRLRDGEEWIQLDYDDSAWTPALRSGQPLNQGTTWGVADLHTLFPRDVPALTEDPHRFIRTLRDHHVQPHAFGHPPAGWTLPAGAGGTIVLAAGELTTGYPEFRFKNGRDREVRITYSEALGTWTEVQGTRVWQKQVRDDLAGEPHGYRDTVVLSGRGDRFEPFHWRTFWFVKIEVLPGATECELVDVTYRRCIYPQKLLATYQSSDPQSAAMWSVSWRTLQLCAHETYEDCPYFEQLNYVADTRLQALGSLYLANEHRLARRCIRLFRDSLNAEGLIGARVPSIQRQTIPFFCLHWIFMLEDYWRWIGHRDAAFVRSCLPAVDGILVYFRNRLRSDGFVGEVPRWNVVDRATEWLRGEPPAVVAGESTYLTCLYIQALAAAIRLHEEAGSSRDADRWRALPDYLRTAVQREAWDEQRGLFLEGPDRVDDRPSQHTQSAAIVSGAATEEQRVRIFSRLLSDPDLLPARHMQSFYVARALEETDHYAEFHRKLLQPWRDMLAHRTTTWWEYPNPTRSDCHGWSSWIAVDFLSTVLGIRPAAPGWAGIRLAPHCDGLTWARGSVDTPVGRITVSWRREDKQVILEAETPRGIPVELHLPGEPSQRFPHGGPFHVRTSALLV